MDDLRSAIRAAFDREQAVHPPAPTLRRNVVEAVAARPRPARNLQWLAVAAAVLLGLAVVAGLMSSRLAHRAPVPGNKANYGPPPAGVPLLYVHDPNNASWLIGYDWTGRPRGTVTPRHPLLGGGASIDMAPDGQQFQVVGANQVSGGVFMDRLGQPLQNSPHPVGFTGGMWADDSRHLCVMALQPNGWILVTEIPGYSEEFVNLPKVGQTVVSVIACSVRNDRAILVRTMNSAPSELWVVRLSNGKVLSHHTYATGLLANIVASSDAAYLAENSAGYPPSAVPEAALVTAIKRASDWIVVGSLSPSMQVLAFSGDGLLVLVSTAPSGSGAHLAIVDWRSGQTGWRYDGPQKALYSVLAQPGGRNFAIALGSWSAPTCPPEAGCVGDQLRDILIVHGDGSSTAIPGRYMPVW